MSVASADGPFSLETRACYLINIYCEKSTIFEHLDLCIIGDKNLFNQYQQCLMIVYMDIISLIKF